MFGTVTENAIISPRLCHPDDKNEHPVYRQAHAGQWLGYDFNRSKYFPKASEARSDPLRYEGTLRAFMLDELEDVPDDTRTEINFTDFLTVETLFKYDKPTIERLHDIGFVTLRSHEDAYEAAGQEHWIDELRSRSVARDPVYQITPKGHLLISLEEDAGKKTPRKDAKPILDRLPGILPA